MSGFFPAICPNVIVSQGRGMTVRPTARDQGGDVGCARIRTIKG